MTSDGLFNMPAIITYPLNFDPTKKYPVVFTIYGGPDSKNVYNRWQGNIHHGIHRTGLSLLLLTTGDQVSLVKKGWIIFTGAWANGRYLIMKML